MIHLMDQFTMEIPLMKNQSPEVRLSVSHSAKKTYLTCPQKYYLKYGHCLEPTHLSKPLRMGSAFSLALEMWSEDAAEEWYEGYWTDLPEARFYQEVEQKIVTIMARHYMLRYDKHERELEIPEHMIGEGRYAGFIDGRIDPTTLVEDKFKGQWTEKDVEMLKLDDQTIGYVAMYSLNAGVDPASIVVKYRPTRRPGLRQGKETKTKPAESDTDFLIRIEQDVIARPEHYFYEEDVRVTDDMIIDWWESTRGTAQLMAHSKANDIWPRNTGACQQYGGFCEMWKICSARGELELSAVLDDYKTTGERR